MRTVSELIEELQKFPGEAECWAHDGKVTGIGVRLGMNHGFIHLNEQGENPPTVFAKSGSTIKIDQTTFARSNRESEQDAETMKDGPAVCGYCEMFPCANLPGCEPYWTGEMAPE